MSDRPRRDNSPVPRPVLSRCVPLILVALCGCHAQQSRSTPGTPSSSGRWQSPSAGAGTHSEPAPPTTAQQSDELPRAVPDTLRFDFGTMEPGQVKRHTFRVRNEGTAPLRLQAVTASCKCTLSIVNKRPILGFQRYRIGWVGGGVERFFGRARVVQVCREPGRDELAVPYGTQSLGDALQKDLESE